MIGIHEYVNMKIIMYENKIKIYSCIVPRTYSRCKIFGVM
jgi:hypothetical protein